MAGISLYKFTTAIVLAIISIFGPGASLRCYTCNQRVQNAAICLTSVMEDCSALYPQNTSICMRSVQKSFDGMPPWVFSQCYALGMPTDPLLNQCELKEIRGRANILLYTLEICSCTQDLCNGGPGAFQQSSAIPQAVLIPQPVVVSRPVVVAQPVVIPPLPQPAVPSTTGLQCYKCNQRFQYTYNCRNPIIENCDTTFPGQVVVCGRRVQTFTNGDPPWVLAQCEPRNSAMAVGAFPTGLVTTSDSCNTVNDQFGVIETCICSTPLCNMFTAALLTPSAGVISPPILGGFNQLRCYKCNERLVNRTTCANRTAEDCAAQYPYQPVACVRSVQTFSDGQAPWVIERCQIRALFPEVRPNDCWSQPLTGAGANGTDYLEFCTCISDFCNTEAIMTSRAIQALNATISSVSS